MVAVPTCILCDAVIWYYLCLYYRPEQSAEAARRQEMVQRTRTVIPASQASSLSALNRKQVFILLVSVVTILLWCMEHQVRPWFGGMGMIALLPLIAFFGFGLLSKEDLNAFLWSVVLLAMGGIALGKACKSSGLLDSIGQAVASVLHAAGTWTIFAVFSVLVLFIATFISHTVAATIMLPLMVSLKSAHGSLLVMGIAFVCSIAMGLPVSGKSCLMERNGISSTCDRLSQHDRHLY